MKKLFFLVVAGLLIFSSPVFAYTVIDNNGFVEGITDLTVGELGTFDVAFIWDSFTNVYSSHDIVLQNSDEAFAASSAVNEALNSVNAALLREAGTATQTATNYHLTFDYAESTFWFIYNSMQSLTGYHDWATNPNIYSVVNNPTITAMHAVFTPVQSTVPVPGAVWLLGSGLMGLIGLRRKFGR